MQAPGRGKGRGSEKSGAGLGPGEPGRGRRCRRTGTSCLSRKDTSHRSKLTEGRGKAGSNRESVLVGTQHESYRRREGQR